MIRPGKKITSKNNQDLAAMTSHQVFYRIIFVLLQWNPPFALKQLL